ncbi:MAG: hypothetical protein ACKOED_12875, partial [Aestuariivirga sp.]|uniref:hypothetical protein n=1 Tax=Aestuariivirga sp. TaxID=2650926 RepID=UPI0038D1F79E
ACSMPDALTGLIGHNSPPPDLLLGEPLRDRLAEENGQLIARRDELLAAAARIPAIDSDDVAGRVSDYIKQLTALTKAAESKRTDAKEPYLEGGRNIDGFFRAITDPVAKAKTAIERRLTDYLRDKEARARREREERERSARQAAETARREAEAKARALTDEPSLEAAIAAQKAAETASADLVKASQAAAAKPAELSRTRGDYGAVSSLRTQWDFDEIDREALDLEALRFHIPADGLERAVRAFIKAGGRELSGTRIHETTVASVR